MNKRTTGSSYVRVLIILAALMLTGFILLRAIDGKGSTPDTLGGAEPAKDPTPQNAGGADPKVLPTGDATLVHAGGLRTGGRQEVEAVAAADVAGDPKELPGEILAVAGTVVVLGGDPVAPVDIDGKIQVTVWGKKSGRSVDVMVEDGAFRLAYKMNGDGKLVTPDEQHTIEGDPTDHNFEFGQPEFPSIGGTLVAGDDGTPVSGKEPRIPFASEGVTIYVIRSPMTRLTVIDKQTGTPLSGIKIVATRFWDNDDVKHPKGFTVKSLTDESISPVTLRPPAMFLTRTSLHTFVSAEGYAWASIVLDLQSGAERTVELERAGTLSVAIDGEFPRKGRLRLYPVSPGVPLSEVRVRADGPVVWERLAPGEYSVRAELGEWFESPTVLASEVVTVEAGADANAKLGIAPVVVADRAKASGVVVIPPAWELESFYMTFELLGGSSDGSKQKRLIRDRDLQAVPGRPNTRSFDIPPMEVGRYAFSLEPMGWKELYDLPPEGREDLRFELSEPVELTVHVIEKATGNPAGVGRVTWNPRRPKGSGGGGSMTQSEPESPGLFRFNVIDGEIELSCWGDGYNNVYQAIDVRSTKEVTLEVSRTCRATLTLREGTNSVPWPESHMYQITSIPGGKRTYFSSGYQNGKPWFCTKEPGRYSLKVPEINGYAAHEPVEFEMLRGEEIEIVIDLVPR